MSQNKSLLIIDDDFTNNLICENILKKIQYFQNIKSVLNIQEGIDYILQHKNTLLFPEVVLLDLRFPEGQKTGWDFLTEFSSMNDVLQNINLYVLTSSIARRDMALTETYPFIKGFISKPLNEEKIKKIMSGLTTA
jgi:response regulator RpfG family c-di-GMP phosphodiesterase